MSAAAVVASTSPEALVVIVPGRPVPCARTRGVYHGTPRATAEYKSKVAAHARVAAAEIGWRMCGPVSVDIAIYSVRDDFDGDNLEKGVLDALVRAKVLVDDKVKHVPAASRQWTRVEPKLERVEIQIAHVDAPAGAL